VLTHDASATAFVRDALCIVVAWFAAAVAVRLYTRFAWWRLAVTWLVGVSAGVLVRAAIVGHLAVDFWAVALAFTALFVLAGRLIRTRVISP
jgi:glucose-6-phosphate-specific signal transduction histidine kinase